MQGDGVGGQSAGARAGHLQPSGWSGTGELDAPVSQDDLGQMDDRYGRNARRQQESIERRLRDRQLVELLGQGGFAGFEYDRFVEELARYGISVLRGWMHSGYIFHLLAVRGFRLNPHELQLENLTDNSELREELASMTVACALPRFRQRALMGGGWRFEGGASITTYFIGACLYVFCNEWRKHCAGEKRHQRSLQQQKVVYEDAASTLGVPDDILGNLQVLEHLRGIQDPRTRAAIAMRFDGHSYEEIREMLGAPTVRAIEGMFYRQRRKEQRYRKGGAV
ncbi:hypothetical protein OHB14_61980 [Streptomyces sp. NBC_01613]|uniref:RNA polymerase sigma factor n=1 Tax=Streptomyces sp. NBC_01613 TaxID=2975896 RepID=UPI003865D283